MSEEAAREVDGRVVLRLVAKPGSSEEEIAGIDPWRRAIVVHLRSPPTKGEANAELVGLLAAALGVPAEDVAILSGHRSRRKTVGVAGVTLDHVTRCLEAYGEPD